MIQGRFVPCRCCSCQNTHENKARLYFSRKTLSQLVYLEKVIFSVVQPQSRRSPSVREQKLTSCHKAAHATYTHVLKHLET